MRGNIAQTQITYASVMRSKYATYEEYHTSLDNLKVVTNKGLSQSLNIYKNY